MSHILAASCLSSVITLQLERLRTEEKAADLTPEYESDCASLYEYCSARCPQNDPGSIDSGVDLTVDGASYIPQFVLDNTEDFMTRFRADEICAGWQLGDFENSRPQITSDAHGVFDFEVDHDYVPERDSIAVQTPGLQTHIPTSGPIPVKGYGSSSSLDSVLSTILLSESEQSFIGSEHSNTEFESCDISQGAMSGVQDQLADILLNGFLALPMLSGKSIKSHTGYPASSSTSSWSQAWSNGSSQTCYSSSSGLSKRSRQDDDGQEDSRRSRKRRLGTGKQEPVLKLFACPFVKFDSFRYSEQNTVEKHYRGCSSSYLKDISRLKQHLYRVHRLPEHCCLSCYDVFDSRSELEGHSRQRPACDVRPARFAERMTADQMQQIKRKQSGSTITETWYNIYNILFPGSRPPPTPYAETKLPTETLQRFLNYVEDEGPALLSELLHTELAGTLMLDRERQAVLEVALETAMSRLVDRLTPGLRQIANASTTPDSGLRQIPEAEEPSLNNPYIGLPDLVGMSMDFEASGMIFDIEEPEQSANLTSYAHAFAPQSSGPESMVSTSLPFAATRVSAAGFVARSTQPWTNYQDSVL